MKRICLVVALLAIFACACSKKSPPPVGAAPAEDEAAASPKDLVSPPPPASFPAKTETATPSLNIKSMSFSPQNPTAADDLTIIPVLEKDDTEVYFVCQWVVNNAEIPDWTDTTLNHMQFRKNQWLYCRVKAVKGEQESIWFKSQWLRVANAPPVVELAPGPEIIVPGVFRYQINASDSDGDVLHFVLLKPKDVGLELNEKSGDIVWDVSSEIVEKIGLTPAIEFEVSDGDGGKVTASLLMSFKGRE